LDPDAFWGEDSSAIHDAVEAPTAPSGRGRGRLAAVAALAGSKGARERSGRGPAYRVAYAGAACALVLACAGAAFIRLADRTPSPIRAVAARVSKTGQSRDVAGFSNGSLKHPLERLMAEHRAPPALRERLTGSVARTYSHRTSAPPSPTPGGTDTAGSVSAVDVTSAVTGGSGSESVVGLPTQTPTASAASDRSSTSAGTSQSSVGSSGGGGAAGGGAAGDSTTGSGQSGGGRATAGPEGPGAPFGPGQMG